MKSNFGNLRFSHVILLVLLVAAAIALVANAVMIDLQTRSAAPRDDGNIVDTAAGPANVKVEGEGPTIVLLHGFSGAINTWDDIVPTLSSGHRIIRVDLIGHGGTSAPREGYGIEHQAKFVMAILEKLGVARFTIIGYSLGGEVATAIAESQPQRVESIILLGTPPSKFKFGMRLEATPVLGQFLARVGLLGFLAGITAPKSSVANFNQLTYTAFKATRLEAMRYQVSKPVFERLAALNPTPPLLFIFCSRDSFVSPSSAKLYQAVAGAKIEMIEGCTHGLLVEEPRKVAHLIAEFLGAGRPSG